MVNVHDQLEQPCADRRAALQKADRLNRAAVRWPNAIGGH